MTRRALVTLIVAVLLAGGAAAVIASTVGGGSDSSEVHTLQNGDVHTGPMPAGEHEMKSGTKMNDMEMGK